MRLTATRDGWFGEHDGEHRHLPAAAGADALLAADDPRATADDWFAAGTPAEPSADVLAPIGSQEVWAAGVTYLRSRDAHAVQYPAPHPRSRTGSSGTRSRRTAAAHTPLVRISIHRSELTSPSRAPEAAQV